MRKITNMFDSPYVFLKKHLPLVDNSTTGSISVKNDLVFCLFLAQINFEIGNKHKNTCFPGCWKRLTFVRYQYNNTLTP